MTSRTLWPSLVTSGNSPPLGPAIPIDGLLHTFRSDKRKISLGKTTESVIQVNYVLAPSFLLTIFNCELLFASFLLNKQKDAITFSLRENNEMFLLSYDKLTYN